MQNEVNAGNFREDLYFRLSGIHIELPPLRKRKDDIETLTVAFLKEFLGPKVDSLVANVAEAARALHNHDWPGNVRELRNLVEIASYSEQRPIDLSAFLYLGRSRAPRQHDGSRFAADRPFKIVKQELIQEFEKHYIDDLLKRHDGNVSKASRDAGIERAYLQRLLRKHGLR